MFLILWLTWTYPDQKDPELLCSVTATHGTSLDVGLEGTPTWGATEREKHSREMVQDEGTILADSNTAFSVNSPLEGKILLL